MRIRRPAALTAVAAAALVAPVIAATHAPAAPASKRFLKVRVMTYNILELTRDGEMMKGGSRVAPWSQRKYAVARYIHSVEPGIVAIQEGSSWVAQKKGPRQVDSLVNALGGDYGLAHTETPPWQRHFLRTGRYLLYRKALYAPVGQGWHRDLGKKSWMAYQEFKDKATGLRFLATSSHLYHLSGTAANNERYMETKRLIAFGRQWSAHHNHLPVVYAGDFNSHTGGGVTFDGPGVAMRRAHFMNSKAVSPTRKQGKYNSGNLYSRIPPAHKGRNEDYVWAAPGEKVTFWREVLSLSHGRFAGTIPSDHNPVVADLLLPY